MSLHSEWQGTVLLLQFRHEWKAEADPAGEDPALIVRCEYCKAVVEVLMLETAEGLFLRAELASEGEHPVSQEELDTISKSVYAQFVEPALRSDRLNNASR